MTNNRLLWFGIIVAGAVAALSFLVNIASDSSNANSLGNCKFANEQPLEEPAVLRGTGTGTDLLTLQICTLEDVSESQLNEIALAAKEAVEGKEFKNVDELDGVLEQTARDKLVELHPVLTDSNLYSLYVGYLPPRPVH